MATLSRGIVGPPVLILGLLIAAACAPAAQPTPAAAPTRPPTTTAPATKPAESTPAASKPAATAAAKPAASADWKAEWDKVLAAAKKEGKVVVNGARGDTEREAAMQFRKVYPEITVEYFGAPGTTRTAQILSERKGDMYLYDVYLGGTGSGLTLMENNVFDPIRPALFLPEVLDDGKWHGGFDGGFIDKGHQYLYAYLGYLSFTVDVNRDVAPEAELNRVDQLLDPKWKGKIAWQDPRKSGAGQNSGGVLLRVKGEDWFRKLLAQDIVVFDDARLMVESLIRGRYPLAIGSRTEDIEIFKGQGVADHLGNLDPGDPAGAHITGGTGHAALINKVPNPNAAKVFINWLLSKQGQEVYAQSRNLNSRRLDVEGPPDKAPKPGVQYVNTGTEEHSPALQRAVEIAKEMLR